MRKTLQRFCEWVTETQPRRWGFAVALLAILVAVVAVVLKRIENGGPPPAEFPFEILEGEPTFTNPSDPSATYTLHVVSVSTDGRWAGIRVQPEHDELRCWLFDVTQGQFVAALPQARSSHDVRCRPVLHGKWAPDRLLLRQRVERKTLFDGLLRELSQNPFVPSDTFFYELDFSSRQIRLLHQERSGGYKWRFSVYGWLNQSGDRLVYFGGRGVGGATRQEPELIICDLDTNEERMVSFTAFEGAHDAFSWLLFPWDWLPDNRTLVLCDRHSPRWEVRNVYLLDTGSSSPVRRFDIAELFEQVSREGGAAAERGRFVGAQVLAFPGEGRRCRLVAVFRSDRAPDEATADRAGIWDLDLETRKLAPVMNLPWGIELGHALASPSGNSLVSGATSMAPKTAEPSSGTRLVLYTVGQSPRVLPFEAHVWFKPGPEFLNDHEMIYVAPGNEIRKFDLRTWKSELLWRPEGEGVRAEGRGLRGGR